MAATTTAKPERSKLTAAQEKKAEQVVANLAKRLKIKADDQANLKRFVGKYLRWKLSDRNTGPHSHGFNADDRKLIVGTLNAEFNIKAPERKVRQASAKAPAKGKRNNKKSTAQLAREQAARAAGHPVPGTEVIRQGS